MLGGVHLQTQHLLEEHPVLLEQAAQPEAQLKAAQPVQHNRPRLSSDLLAQ